MDGSRRSSLVLGVVAALLWSPHHYALQSSVLRSVPLLTVQFHLVFWSALLVWGLLLLGPRRAAWTAFQRRESRYLALGATGGYGFWVLRALALEAGDPTHVQLLVHGAPLVTVALGALSAERGDRRAVFGLLLGFVGCIVLVGGQAGGAGRAAGAWPGSLAAVGAAACWAAFALVARPLMGEEKALSVAALVLGIGALCLLVTCLSTGQNVLDVTWPQLRRLVVTGLFTVGLMTVAWLKLLSTAPAVLAMAFWYLAVAFGLLWAPAAGYQVSPWWALGGVVLIGMGMHYALAGRRRRSATLGDVIRGR